MRRRAGLFWGAAALVGYTYVGFPLLVVARGRLLPRPYRTADVEPQVSIVIAAYNERAAIGEKLLNTLELEYPADRLEVLVASDGSTDGTNEVVERYAERGVRLLALPRVGKAAALEAAVGAAHGEIIVFSDANSLYARDALRQLVRPFADPSIGGVAGNQRYRPGSAGDAAASGERAYWDFDRLLKEAESRAGSTISATGAIYAIRRSLFRGVPVGVTDDFAVSTAVIAQGYRLVFAPDAVAWEPISASAGNEWARKVRIITRGLRGVVERRDLLDARRHGFYSLQLLSHKLLRRLTGVPLIAMAVLAPTLWNHGPLYRAATIAQGAWYGLGAIGLLVGRRGGIARPLLAAPTFFVMANAAALAAAWNVLRGRRIDRWEPARPELVAARTADT